MSLGRFLTFGWSVCVFAEGIGCSRCSFFSGALEVAGSGLLPGLITVVGCRCRSGKGSSYWGSRVQGDP